MTKLSPATAERVLDAFNAVYESDRHAVAAALRAAADQAAPEKQVVDFDYVHQAYIDGMRDALAVIKEIADKLEAAND
jgi:hypothetical protein